MRRTAVFLSVFLVLAASLLSARSLDYSDPSNWAYLAEGEDRIADVFLICPTVDWGGKGNTNMSMDDEAAKADFAGALNMERGIYEECATLYSPFYRQMTFPFYEGPREAMHPYIDYAYEDVKAAFSYYLEHFNDGRPLILAGFSQGAQHALHLLQDFFSDPELQDLLVAAYLIGWPVTEEDLAGNEHLRLASGESDTGVIITFSTEAEAVSQSIIVPEGMKTYSINPLNWKTDSSYAPASSNLGACFTDYDGRITAEIPCFCGAYIDDERGVLKVVGVNPSSWSLSLFPDGVYHIYDYQFFYRNLQQNVKTRLDSFLAERGKD